MKKIFTILASWLCITANCQDNAGLQFSKTKFVFGFSFSELIHAGLGFDVSKSNQFSFYAGFLPQQYSDILISVTAEHRLYLGKVNERTMKKQFFLRQSFSYHSDRDKGGLLSFTIGKDFSKKIKNGLTADAGIQIAVPKESGDRSIYGNLRLQYYLFFKKNK
jgi:hypothetical protein